MSAPPWRAVYVLTSNLIPQQGLLLLAGPTLRKIGNEQKVPPPLYGVQKGMHAHWRCNNAGVTMSVYLVFGACIDTTDTTHHAVLCVMRPRTFKYAPGQTAIPRHSEQRLHVSSNQALHLNHSALVIMMHVIQGRSLVMRRHSSCSRWPTALGVFGPHSTSA